MRLLPTKPSDNQKLIAYATFDYYGTGLKKSEIPGVRNVALFIMKRKRGLPQMTEEQKSDIWAIKNNLRDKLYINNLFADPPRIPSWNP